MDLLQPDKGEKSWSKDYIAVFILESGSPSGVPTYALSVFLGGGTAAMRA